MSIDPMFDHSHLDYHRGERIDAPPDQPILDDVDWQSIRRGIVDGLIIVAGLLGIGIVLVML